MKKSELNINADKACTMDIAIEQLSQHAAVGGKIENVVKAVVVAKNAGIDLPFSTALAIDAASKENILNLVYGRIHPRVVETKTVKADCKDGRKVAVRASIALRVNLMRVIGGVGAETIIARVSEGILCCIGKANNYNELLSDPGVISKHLLVRQSITSDSMYDILSIDIVKIK